MPRTAITVHTVDRDGLDMASVSPANADATNGNTVPNRGAMWVEAHNTDTNPHDLTFQLIGGRDGQGIEPKTVTMAAGKTFKLGPYPTDSYGGDLLLNATSTTVTFEAFELSAN